MMRTLSSAEIVSSTQDHAGLVDMQNVQTCAIQRNAFLMGLLQVSRLHFDVVELTCLLQVPIRDSDVESVSRDYPISDNGSWRSFPPCNQTRI